jgi:hypothetical protein
MLLPSLLKQRFYSLLLHGVLHNTINSFHKKRSETTNLDAILILGVYLAALRLEFLRFALVVSGALRLRGSCRKCWFKVSFEPDVETRVVLVFERSTGW